MLAARDSAAVSTLVVLLRMVCMHAFVTVIISLFGSFLYHTRFWLHLAACDFWTAYETTTPSPSSTTNVLGLLPLAADISRVSGFSCLL